MRVQLTLIIETGAQQIKVKSDQVGMSFQGYIPELTEEQAGILFERKFGYPPEVVLRSELGMMAGPVRNDDGRD